MHPTGVSKLHVRTRSRYTIAEADRCKPPGALWPPRHCPLPTPCKVSEHAHLWLQGLAESPALSQAYTPPELDAVTRVSTPLQLQQAMQQGARHIVVEAHLDLSVLELVDIPDVPEGTPSSEGYLLGIVRDATHSITVRF